MIGISEIINAVSGLLGEARGPLIPIPGILLRCTAMRRPGISAAVAAAGTFSSQIKGNFEDDTLKRFIFNYVETLKTNMQDDGVCNIVFPPGSILFQLSSANAGGPVTLIGTNNNFVLAWGIIR